MINPITNTVITPSKQTEALIYRLNLSSNKIPVTIVNCAKYLGVIVENEFNFLSKLK